MSQHKQQSYQSERDSSPHVDEIKIGQNIVEVITTRRKSFSETFFWVGVAGVRTFLEVEKEMAGCDGCEKCVPNEHGKVVAAVSEEF